MNDNEITRRDINASFEYIRSTFFPRWDRQHKWKAVLSRVLHPNSGYCDTERKQIIINPSVPNLRNLDERMIHEIAHATASIGHDKKFIERLEKASLKAEGIGCQDLATEIRKDCEVCSGPAIMATTKNIKRNIEDAVRYNKGLVPFKELITKIANFYGMTYGEMLIKFGKRKLWRIYEGSRKEFEEEEEAEVFLRQARSTELRLSEIQKPVNYQLSI